MLTLASEFQQFFIKLFKIQKRGFDLTSYLRGKYFQFTLLLNTIADFPWIHLCMLFGRKIHVHPLKDEQFSSGKFLLVCTRQSPLPIFSMTTTRLQKLAC